MKRRFGQQQRNRVGREQAFARELQFMIVRRMRLVMMLVVMIVFGLGVMLVIARMRCAGCAFAAVMHFGQQMNPNVIYLERKQSRGQQTNPPPTRSRAGRQSAWLS
jgi:ABC-type protease/lipase transport system fused ATPase/permease subunit